MDAFASLAVFERAKALTVKNKRLSSNDYRVGLAVKIWRGNTHVASGHIADIPESLNQTKIRKGKCVIRIEQFKINNAIETIDSSYCILSFSRLSIWKDPIVPESIEAMPSVIDTDESISVETREALDPSKIRSRIIQDVWHLMDRVMF